MRRVDLAPALQTMRHSSRCAQPSGAAGARRDLYGRPVRATSLWARGMKGTLSMTVIEHDFGLAARRAERRFTKLLELDALHEANVRANPLPYLERASERIFRLQEVLFDALQAAKTSGAEPQTEDDYLRVGKDEYARLKKCLDIVEKGFALYGEE
jgi:hypothetical protein